MSRFRLRTLLIIMAVLPPLVWAGWLGWQALAKEVLKALINAEESVKPAAFDDDTSNPPIRPAR